MITTVTADWHLRDWGSSSKNKLHTDHIIQCIERAESLIVAGDVFHRFGKVNAVELDMFNRIAQTFPDATYILSGNHDYYKHSHSVLDKIWTRNVNAWGLSAYMLDWSPEWEMCVESHCAHPVLISHGPLRYSITPGGYELTEGADADIVSDNHMLVILGDIHRMQQIRANIWYCGSPLALDRGEFGKKSGVLEVDFENFLVTPVYYNDPGLVTPQAKPQVQAVELKPRLAKSTIHSTAKELFYLYASQYNVPDEVVEAFRGLTVEDDWTPLSSGAPLIPESMTVKNFMCFKGEHSASLGRGLHLVQAENLDDPTVDNNNSGKTAVLSALYWCLTGKTLHNVTADAVVHHGERDCHVQVTFTDGRYIRRERVDGKPSVRVNSARSAGNSADAQDTINKMLGLSPKQLSLCCTLSSSFGSATDTQRKEMLDHLLGEDRFKPYQTAIERRVKELEGEWDARVKEIARIDGEVEKLRAMQGMIQSMKQQWEAAKARRIQDQVAKVEQVLSSLELSREELAGHIMEEKSLTVPDLTGLEAAEAAALEAFVRADSLPKAGDTDCPQCGRRYDNAPSEEEVAGNARVLADATASLDKARAALRSGRAEVDYAKTLRREIDALQKTVDKLTTSLREEQETLASIERETCPQEPIVDGEIARLQESKAAEEEAEREAARQLECHVKLLEIFGKKGLRLFLFDLLQSQLNPLLAKYLHALSDGMLEARIELNEGKLVFPVTYRGGAEGYNSNSTGTQHKVDLAVLMAAAEVYQAPLRLLLADEFAGNLDSVAAMKAFDLLQDYHGCVVATTHKEIIHDSVVQSIHVTRCNSTSSFSSGGHHYRNDGRHSGSGSPDTQTGGES